MFTTKEVLSGGVSGKNALTIAGGVAFLLSTIGIEKIDRGEVGIVARYGRPERKRGLRKGKLYRKNILEPGWHLVMPLVGTVEKASVAKITNDVDTIIRSEEGNQLAIKSKFDWAVVNKRFALNKALFEFSELEEYKQSMVGMYADALRTVLSGKPETIINDTNAVKELLFQDNPYHYRFYGQGAMVHDLRIESAAETADQVHANAIVEAARIRGDSTVEAAGVIASALGGLGIGSDNDFSFRRQVG